MLPNFSKFNVKFHQNSIVNSFNKSKYTLLQLKTMPSLKSGLILQSIHTNRTLFYKGHTCFLT
jgi:hypothetical protein